MSEKTPKSLKQMMQVGEWYAFSANPDEQYDQSRKYSPKDRPLLLINTMYRKLKPLSMYCKYVLYPEFAPSSGRWHYHGKIQINDPFNFYLRLPSVMKHVSYEFDVINDSQIWEEYITKEEYYMKDQMKIRGLPYPLTNEYDDKPKNPSTTSPILEYFHDTP